MNANTCAHMLLEREKSEGFTVADTVFGTLEEIFSRYDAIHKDERDPAAHFVSVDRVLKDMGFEYNESLDKCEYRYDVNRGVAVRFLGSNLLSASLQERKISCFHYCTIHQSVSDIMRYPVKTVLVRGGHHMFMRWRYDENTYVNYEPTGNELNLPDEVYARSVDALFECDERISGAQVYYHLGTEWRNRNEFARAEHNYDLAIEEWPDFSDAFRAKGRCLLMQADYESSRDAYSRAIEIDGSDEESLLGRGLALDFLEEYAESIRDYDRAIELNRDRALAYFNRAVVYDKVGRGEDALRDYERSIALDPNYAAAHFNLGVKYDNLGYERYMLSDFGEATKLLEKAIGCYDAAISIDAAFDLPYAAKGVCLQLIGSPDDDLSALRKRAEDGIGCLQKALQINPDNADAKNNLQMACARLAGIDGSRW